MVWKIDFRQLIPRRRSARHALFTRVTDALLIRALLLNYVRDTIRGEGIDVKITDL